MSSITIQMIDAGKTALDFEVRVHPSMFRPSGLMIKPVDHVAFVALITRMDYLQICCDNSKSMATLDQRHHRADVQWTLLTKVLHQPGA